MNILLVILLRKKLKLASLFVVAETVVMSALLFLAADAPVIEQINSAILGSYYEPLRWALTANTLFGGLEVSTFILIQVLSVILFVYLAAFGLAKAVQYILKKAPSPIKVEQHDKITNKNYRGGGYLKSKLFLVTCRLRN